MKATSGPAQRGVTSRSLYGLRLPGMRLEDGAASGIRRGARGGLELRPGRGAAYARSSISGSRPFFSCESRHVAAQPRPQRSASDLPQLAVMIRIEGCLKASRDLSMETPNMDCEHRVLPGTRPPSPETAQASGGVALFNPCGLAVSAAGRTYIADTGHHRVVELTAAGKLCVLAGSGERGFADGVGEKASFAHPCGLAVDSDGCVFVADCGNHCIRRVTPAGEVSTIAGSGSAGMRDGLGRAAQFYNPCGIAIDGADTMYVADYSNNAVRIVSKGGVVGTFTDASGPGPHLDSPYGIAAQLSPGESGGVEAVYVSSYHSHSLARVAPDGAVTMIAGCGASRHADGAATTAAFHAPNGLAVDTEGNLYVCDSGNHCIRKVLPDGSVSTIAGSGAPELSASGFNSPCGVCLALLPSEDAPALLVTDRANSCVRVVHIDALPPPRVAPSTLRQVSRRLRTRRPYPTRAYPPVHLLLACLPPARICARCSTAAASRARQSSSSTAAGRSARPNPSSARAAATSARCSPRACASARMAVSSTCPACRMPPSASFSATCSLMNCPMKRRRAPR